jgi:nucleoside-diphosphate-sugar epimerase
MESGMTDKIFLAGAAGAIGLRLSRLLVARNFEVTGTTRSQERADQLRSIGVEPVLVDVFDATALAQSVVAAQPDVVMHQLTDLSGGFDEPHRKETLAHNARIRREGTANLIRAALGAGARRIVAQSIAWMYRPRTPPYRESDPLLCEAEGDRGISLGGVKALETQVLNTRGIEGVVLRYGTLYGPGTGRGEPHDPSPVHVDAAAYAAMLAAERGAPGLYNIAEPGGEVDSGKAVRELGWSADFRLPADAGKTAP